MHELSVTKGLLSTVLDTAEKEKIKKINSISISIGEFFDYVPEIIQEYFDSLSEGTVAGGARINASVIPIRIYCSRCDKEYEGRQSALRCVQCGCKDIKLLKGKEFFIETLEVDE